MAEKRRGPTRQRLAVSSPVHVISVVHSDTSLLVGPRAGPGSRAADAIKLGLRWEALGSHPIIPSQKAGDGQR